MKDYFIVTGVVRFHDKLLLLKRKQSAKQWPNVWEFISGFPLEHEELGEAISRELMEEINLIPETTRKGNIIRIDDNSTRWWIMPYLIEIESVKDLKLNKKEHSEFTWLNADELEDSGLSLVIGIPEILESLNL